MINHSIRPRSNYSVVQSSCCKDDEIPSPHLDVNKHHRKVKEETTLKQSEGPALKNKTNVEGFPQRDERKVHFQPYIRVRKVSSHRRYTEIERANAWYSQYECNEIKKSAVKTVKKMMRGTDVDNDTNDCSRGLEFKIPEKNKIRQKRKLDIIWGVLEVQDFLSSTGMRDAERIGSVYRTLARRCALEAHKRGLKDEAEAL